MHQPHRLSGPCGGELQITWHSLKPHSIFRLAIKRSGGLDIRKEIDQLNHDDPEALLEQIIFFVINVEVHWCHAISVVFFFFLLFLLDYYRRGWPPFPSIEILTAALDDYLRPRYQNGGLIPVSPLFKSSTASNSWRLILVLPVLFKRDPRDRTTSRRRYLILRSEYRFRTSPNPR